MNHQDVSQKNYKKDLAPKSRKVDVEKERKERIVRTKSLRPRISEEDEEYIKENNLKMK
jgi:hypothetical protein